jgi:hypothetical protein
MLGAKRAIKPGDEVEVQLYTGREKYEVVFVRKVSKDYVWYAFKRHTARVGVMGRENFENRMRKLG